MGIFHHPPIGKRNKKGDIQEGNNIQSKNIVELRFSGRGYVSVAGRVQSFRETRSRRYRFRYAYQSINTEN